MKTLLFLCMFSISSSLLGSEKHLALGYKYLLEDKKELAQKSLVRAFENSNQVRVLARSSYLLTMTKFNLKAEDHSYFALNALKYNKMLSRPLYEALQRKSADILFKAGKLNRALLLFDSLIQKSQDFSLREYSTYKKGWILVNQGRYLQLITLYSHWLLVNKTGDLREIIASDLGKFLSEAIYLDRITRVRLPEYDYETLVQISKGLNNGYRRYQSLSPLKLLKQIENLDLYESTLSLILENNIYYKEKSCDVLVVLKRLGPDYSIHYETESIMKYLKLCAKRNTNSKQLISILNSLDFNEKNSYEKALLLLKLNPEDTGRCNLLKAHFLETDDQPTRDEFIKAFVTYCPRYQWQPEPYDLTILTNIISNSEESSIRQSLLTYFISIESKLEILKRLKLSSFEIAQLVSSISNMQELSLFFSSLTKSVINKDVVIATIPLLSRQIKTKKLDVAHEFVNLYYNKYNLSLQSAKILFILSKTGYRHSTLSQADISKSLSTPGNDKSAKKYYLATLLDNMDLKSIMTKFSFFKPVLLEEKALFKNFIEKYLSDTKVSSNDLYLFKFLDSAKRGERLGRIPPELKPMKELVNDINTYSLCQSFKIETYKAKLTPKYLSRIFKRIDYTRRKVSGHLWTYEHLLIQSNQNLSESIKNLASRLQNETGIAEEVKELLISKLEEREAAI